MANIMRRMSIPNEQRTSHNSAEPRHECSTSEVQHETKHLRRRSSFRSIRSFIRTTSRSISRPRNPLKREDSVDKNVRPARSLSRKRRFFRRGSSSVDVGTDQGDYSMMSTALQVTQLPRVEHQTRLSADLAQYTSAFGDELNRDGHPRRALRPQTRKLSENGCGVVPIATLLTSDKDPFSEDVADYNIAASSQRQSFYGADAFPPRRLSHKPELDNLKTVDASSTSAHAIAPRSTSISAFSPERRRISRSSLHKPLPELPYHQAPSMRRHHFRADSAVGHERGYLVRDAKEPVDLKAHIDLSNTEETHMELAWSPAVTKETRVVNTHEIVQQAVTKEIHNHHYHHRILPVVDVEVLPPRHFVPAEDGGYREIPEDEIPGGGNTEELQEIVKAAVSNLIPCCSEDVTGPRKFTARTFEDGEGDSVAYTTPQGVQRSEQWWVHPPSEEAGARQSGQTLPFYFGSSPWKDATRDRVTEDSKSQRETPSSSPSRLLSGMRTVLPIRMVHGEK